jgi:membrane-anchored glycerophosphoryl diester phosphodiesterase (GDPDase)
VPNLAFTPGGETALPVILIFVAVWIIYIWLYVKLILALPNAAVTGRISLARSWNALRGNVWRFIGYSLVILLTYMVPIFLLALIGAGLLEAQGNPLIALVLNLLVIFGSLFLGVSFLAYLSYVYRQLIAKPAQDAWAQNGGTT